MNSAAATSPSPSSRSWGTSLRIPQRCAPRSARSIRGGRQCTILTVADRWIGKSQIVCTKGVVSAPDPRNPLVVDIRDLGRRAGTLREIHRVVPAPADFGIALARVPEGSDLDLDLRLESVVEGVLVTGVIGARVEGECARCVDPLTWEEDATILELFRYPASDARGARIAEEFEDDQEATSWVEDDSIDLESVVRDAVVLGLPMVPLCSAECAGLCPTCGLRLAGQAGHRHDTVDPRWEALRTLVDAPSDDQPDSRPEDK